MPLRCSILFTSVFLAASFAEACTIPVFRYALDRWEADKFHLLLPASAAQDSALQDLLRPLRANGKANLDITTSKDPALTVAELRPSRDAAQPLWSGKLDGASLASLLDSPARQQILRGILAGDSLVWVLADSGSSQDDMDAARIEKRLKFLEQVAALPIQDPNDPDSQLGPGPPLKLKFTLLRLRRDDPAEQILLRMLAGPQEKTKLNPATTSFAAVIFGKGRVLGAWPLADLDDRSLEETSMFLVGRCSCRLKTENPGWDLLINIDWEKALKAASAPTAGASGPGTASSAAPVSMSDSQPAAVTITASAPPKTAEVPTSSSWAIFGGAGAAALAALLLGLRK